MAAVTDLKASPYRVVPAPAFFTKKDRLEIREFFRSLKPMISLQKAIRKIRERIAFSLNNKQFTKFVYAEAKQ